MRKLILAIIIMTLNSSMSLSQYGWFWQYPRPVGSHLEDCFFTSENTGYAVGWDGTIIKTTNAGSEWMQLNSGSNRFLYSVFFTNQTTGFVISGDESFPTNNILLKTTNEGVSWEQKYSFTNTHLSCVYFINESVGFIVGGRYWSGGRIFKTTDSGNNWSQFSPDPTTNFINSVFFTSDSVGYVAGDDGRVLKTTNQGNNWISIINSGVIYNQFSSIYFINSNTGFVAGESGSLYKTTNGGANWLFDSTRVTEHLWDIKFKDNNTGFITVGGYYVSVTGKVLKTTNSGSTWDIMQTNNTQNFRGISIVNDNIFAVGYWGTVVNSTNSGLNWVDLSNSTANNYLFDSYVFDSLNCIVIGDSSKILKTFDGGKTWLSTNLGNNYSLNSIYFVDQNTGYIAGGYSVTTPPYPYYTYYYSKIFKSTNAGLSWNLIFGMNNEYSILKSITFTSGNTGYCVGSGGYLRKTTNGGMNWATQNLGTGWLYSVNFINPNTGFICGSSGNLYKTTDSGNTWITINTGISSSLYSITFPSENTGYTCSSNSQVRKTTNSGLNWISSNTNIPYEFDINSIYFINDNTGLAAGVSFPDYGRAGDIVNTTDGGLNWQRLSVFSSYPTYQRRGLNSIHFLNNKTGYIVGEHSTILKTINGGNSVDVKHITTGIPSSYSLSQNYPNPFNPITKIKFDVSKSNYVRIVVYDITGREIQTLVNEKLQPGTYETTFDGSQLTSGVYFYKMITDSYSETKKMILIK
ncbi:MAG: YCF48-related protein [Ignavibacteriae bacterium]|nr:YCF48-related protein [Ignavibacteriota bacterium]